MRSCGKRGGPRRGGEDVNGGFACVDEPDAEGPGGPPVCFRRQGGTTVELDKILQLAHEADASDIHIVAGHQPTMRVHQIVQRMDLPQVAAEDASRYFREIAPDEAQSIFERQKDSDFSFAKEQFGRYRVNAHMQRGAVAMSLRTIKTKVPPLEKLSLPDIIARLTYLPRGLVLVTGDTGSGKSTTLAAMIQAMNERYAKHIITLEDPIEYALESEKCLIEQRELGHRPDDSPGRTARHADARQNVYFTIGRTVIPMPTAGFVTTFAPTIVSDMISRSSDGSVGRTNRKRPQKNVF